ncbi:hypothetical protein L1987_00502 [Smallanthus sonchifolius]|uniref:Uncharacterized protein n=1 Tax=Smallanthus sonchifolius TaxID=185202 RepID=A0ACB9K2G7_9ASTR|nr:hypothetical protein L1987_00502 [Smallanthus sonchifolius]
MGRAPCCDKASVKKGPWSPEEDAKLKDFIEKHGHGGNWIALPHKVGLKRCGKSCRLRWLNYLRPNIKHGEFSEDEDRIICNLYVSIGSRWSIIASQLPGRTDNDIKNYWNTKLRKKLLAMLPSSQKKPSFSPSMTIQSPPLSDHHKPDSFLNASSSSSFYNYNPNFMIASHTMNPNTHFQTHTNSLTDLFSQPASIPLISNYFGFQIKQEDQFALKGFGDQNHGFMTDHNNYFDQRQKGCFKNLEEVKQLIGINNSSSSINVDIHSYLMNGDDENKTTHAITDGFYTMIDGSN